MILNYIKTALRNFIRNKAITLIKILGLALGLASIFFILIFIIQETSYNKYLDHNEQIYRIIQQNNVHHWKTPSMPYLLRDELLATYPDITKATRVYDFHSTQIEMNQNTFIADDYICADQDFFEIFEPQIINGKVSDFDSDPYQVAISKSIAKKLFGSTDVINNELKLLNHGKEIQVIINAVYEDFPVTSTIHPDFISPIELFMTQISSYMPFTDNVQRDVSFYKENWELEIFRTYILYDKNADAKSFQKISDDITARKFENPNDKVFYLQPITDVYLQSAEILGTNIKGSLKSIYIFSAVAFLVLFIASINYIILSTSQIVARTKEIGVRKIIGARRRSLFKLFFSESFIITVIAFVLAFIIIEQFRPLIDQFFDKQIIIMFNWKMISGVVTILGIVTLAPAVYMTYYFNRISPIDIMRKKSVNARRGFSLKKLMIALQYIIFIALVVSAIGIVKQLKFAMHSDLGFNPENKLVIPAVELVQAGKFQTAKQELLKMNEINNISGAMWLPPSNSRMSMNMSVPDYPDEKVNVEGLFVDQDFIETFDLKMVEGNNFQFYGDNAQGKVIMNEKARQYFDIGDDVWGNEIIGVVQDFKFHSFHEQTGPMFLVAGDFMVRDMVIHYSAKDISLLLKEVNKALLNVYPQMQFNHSFLTDNFDELYKNEKRMAVLITIFSFLAIFIASIGLLGITIFTTKKQTKNIAIRKVNGASISSILMFFIGDYIKIILIALLIASPIAYYILNRWLQNFAYQTNIAWWIFLFAGLLAFIFTLVTISWYSIKAARKNPVESLRYE